MPTETAAELRGVSHRYGGAPALDAVDLDVARGAIVALIGANGSGKTTLLRILAGILEPTSGEVRVLAAGTAGARRRRVGYVSQDPALDPEMTGAEILTLFAALYGVPRAERRRRVTELAEAFGTAPQMPRRIDQWSGGQRRRLHLAAGMIHDPELLCLDEPAAGLDPDGRDFLWAELERRAGHGCAVAIVTHDLAAAQRHAGAVAILDRGRVAAAGEPRSLISERLPTLADVFRQQTGCEPSALTPKAGRRKRRKRR